MSSKEIKSHTGLRGLAALLVVFFHYRTMITPSFDVDAYTGFFAKGYVWVDLFFILSGFIMCYVYGSSTSEPKRAIYFLRARLARVYPLHFATLIFLVLWEQCVGGLTRQQPIYGTEKSFWLNLFCVQAWGLQDEFDWNFPSWSISCETAAYILFPLMSLCLRRYRKSTVFIMGIVALSGIIYISAFGDRIGWERFALFQALPMFAFGCLIQNLKLGRNLSFDIVFAAQVLAVVGLLVCLNFALNDGATIIAFAVIVWSTQKDQGPLAYLLRGKVVRALGLVSYSVYMLHIPVWYVTILVVPHIFQHADGVVVFFVCVFITLGLSSICYSVYEVPARRLLSARPGREVGPE